MVARVDAVSGGQRQLTINQKETALASAREGDHGIPNMQQLPWGPKKAETKA